MLNGDSLLVDIPAVGERIGEYPTTTIKKEERKGKKKRKKNLTFRYESPFAPPGNKNDVSVSVLLIPPERIPLIRGAFSLCLFILLTSYASRFLFTFLDIVLTAALVKQVVTRTLMNWVVNTTYL